MHNPALFIRSLARTETTYCKAQHNYIPLKGPPGSLCQLASQDERDELCALVSSGKQPVRRLKRMQILLAADAGLSDDAIAAAVQTSGSTIYRTKKRFVELSLEAALSEEPRPGSARKLSGKEEVPLVALACSDPPAGRTRWTLKLLASALIKDVEHECISYETVRRRLDDNDLKPWQKKMWRIAKIDCTNACCEDMERINLPIILDQSHNIRAFDAVLRYFPLPRPFGCGKLGNRRHCVPFIQAGLRRARSALNRGNGAGCTKAVN